MEILNSTIIGKIKIQKSKKKSLVRVISEKGTVLINWFSPTTDGDLFTQRNLCLTLYSIDSQIDIDLETMKVAKWSKKG